MISKGDIIGIEDKNDFRTEVLKELLNLFSRKQDIKVTNKNSKKTAIPSTIDIEAENIIRDITEGKISRLKKSLPVEKIKKKTIIKPLYSFLDAEVMLYAKFKKLKFKKTEMKKNKISGLINDLEKKHPEVKRAVVNSYLKLS
jgi:tRNA(Ile)-lysidine synthase TilS/MesJ